MLTHSSSIPFTMFSFACVHSWLCVENFTFGVILCWSDRIGSGRYFACDLRVGSGRVGLGRFGICWIGSDRVTDNRPVRISEYNIENLFSFFGLHSVLCTCGIHCFRNPSVHHGPWSYYITASENAQCIEALVIIMPRSGGVECRRARIAARILDRLSESMKH